MTKNKYAIASNGVEIESIVSDLAARTPFYLPYDQSGNFLVALRNPFADTPAHAAPQAAEFLSEAGITKLVAEMFGHKHL